MTLSTISLLLVLMLSHPDEQTPRTYRLSGFAQGTTWNITYYAPTALVAAQSIDSIFIAIDQSLSTYYPGSLINAFNASDEGIESDQHLDLVVQKAIEIGRKTNGLFDITVKPLVDAWGFGVLPVKSLPSSDTIKGLLDCIGLQHINASNRRITKARTCVQMDLNGIAQGYTVDLLAKYLTAAGINSFIVEVGGEIQVFGRKPSGELMTIGIESPSEDPFGSSSMRRVIGLEKGAITTSGNYRKFYESAGRKVTHIIDPRTGYPHENEIISVTVFADDAMTADGYDNALMLMGIKEAFNFIENQKDISAYFIYKTADGTVRDTSTSGFSRLFIER